MAIEKKKKRKKNTSQSKMTLSMRTQHILFLD